MIISIDHGNKQIKTLNRTFTSGLYESESKPAFGEDVLYYNEKYYVLSEERIPYMRDKTKDNRFFILTLFAIIRSAVPCGSQEGIMKKDECRFNIILNPGDPMHKTAINALNSQGRHKSQFLVNAVVHYIMNEHTASKTVIPTSDEIRTICREILTEMMGEMSPQNIPLIHEEELSEDTSDQDFDLNQIENTLNNFRKK